MLLAHIDVEEMIRALMTVEAYSPQHIGLTVEEEKEGKAEREEALLAGCQHVMSREE